MTFVRALNLVRSLCLIAASLGFLVVSLFGMLIAWDTSLPASDRLAGLAVFLAALANFRLDGEQ